MEPVGPRRRSLLRDGVLLAIPCAALVAVWRLVTTPGIWDDAYISLTAARNLLAGHGLHFSPRLEDYALSTLAWPTLIAVVSALPGDLVAALRLTGIASELFLAISFGLLAYVTLERHVGWALLAVAILLSNPVLLFSTHWGMETALYVGVVAAASLALALDRPRLCLLLAAGAPWTRVDGLAFYLLALALVLTDRLARRPRLADVTRALPSLLFAVAYLALGQLYWGRTLPDSVTTKSAIQLPIAHGEQVRGLAGEFFGALQGRSSYWLTETTAHLWLIPVALVGLWALRQRDVRRAIVLPLLFAVAYVASFLASGKLYASNFPWYFAPPLLAYVLLAVLGLRQLGQALSADRWMQRLRRPEWTRGLAAAGVLTWSLLLLGDVRRDAAALLAREACRERVYRAASEVLSRPLNGFAAPFLAADEIGAIGYAAPPGVEVVDLLGLSQSRQGDVGSTVLALRPAAWITLQSHWPEDVRRAGLAELEWLESRIPCSRPLLIGLRRDLVDDGTLDPSLLEEEIELRLSREAQSIRN